MRPALFYALLLAGVLGCVYGAGCLFGMHEPVSAAKDPSWRPVSVKNIKAIRDPETGEWSFIEVPLPPNMRAEDPIPSNLR